MFLFKLTATKTLLSALPCSSVIRLHIRVLQSPCLFSYLVHGTNQFLILLKAWRTFYFYTSGTFSRRKLFFREWTFITFVSSSTWTYLFRLLSFISLPAFFKKNISQYNSVNMKNKTAEEVYVEMLKPAETVTLKVQHRPEDFSMVKDVPGDGFYIR